MVNVQASLSMSINIAGYRVDLELEGDFNPSDYPDHNVNNIKGTLTGVLEVNESLPHFLSKLFQDLGISDSDFPTDLIPDIVLNALTISYDNTTGIIDLAARASIGGSDIGIVLFTQSSPKTGGGHNYIVGIDLSGLDLSKLAGDIDILKDGLLNGVTINPMLVYASGAIGKTEVPVGSDQTITIDALTASGLYLVATVQAEGTSFNCSLPITGGSSQQTEALTTASKVVAQTTASPSGSGDQKTKWFDVNKTFGPLTLSRLGLGFDGKNVEFLLDASFQLGGLNIGLDGFGLGLAIASVTSWPPQLDFELEGLSISFQNGPVEISGGLLRQGSEFEGEVLIKAETFSISAVGAYTTVDGSPSLFIFSILDYPLGGPEFFFITGVAAGFGYNRGVKIPDVQQIKQFPLVQGALNSASFPNGNNPGDALAQMSDYIYPEKGNDWGAVGLKFTSFQQLNSFALLEVSFGTQFEINLLGISSLSVPSNDPKPIAAAELGLEVNIDPTQGLFKASAALLSGSYVLTPDCQLTGGFIFYIWYAPNPKEGSFVISLGGYDPIFDYSAYGFPAVDRLGFNWRVSSDVQIKGDAYFALTPSCVMAGGALSATYHSGNLKAWFDAETNILIQWKPFHYDFQIGVSIGASYRVSFLFIHKTFTIELGANVHLWGPKLQGTVHVHWFIISFTVDINSPGANDKPPQLSWSDFKTSFLPQQSDNSQSASLAAEGSTTATTTVASISAVNGLIKETKTDGLTHLVINPLDFEVDAKSVIPATTVTVVGANQDLSAYETSLGIRPMVDPDINAVPALAAQLTLTIEKYDESNSSWVTMTALPANLEVDILSNAQVSGALWSTTAYSNQPTADTIANTVGGIKLKSGNLLLYELKELTFTENLDEPIDLTFDWTLIAQPTSDYSQTPSEAISQIETTITEATVVSTRDQIIGSLPDQGYYETSSIDLSKISSEANKIFRSAPGIYTLGAKQQST